MVSLSIFLQPMAAATGWSRTGISTAATINWLSMGVGSFMWGALSDRLGTRAVVLLGGVLLGLGMVSASQATTLLQFQILFGVLVGVATGSFYAPLTATTTRWFTTNRSLAVALVSAGVSLGSTTIAPLARWVITHYDWRMAMLVVGDLVWVIIIPAALLVREPARPPTAPVPVDGVEGPDLTVAAGAAHAAVHRHRAHVLRVLRDALRARSSTWSPTRSTTAISAMAATTVLSVAGPGLAGRQDRLRAHRRSRRRQAHAGGRARAPGGRREPLRLRRAARRASTRSRSCSASPTAA